MAKRLSSKALLMGVTLLFSKVMTAQVLIVPEIQSGGIVLRQQVWSLMVNNMSAQPVRALLSVTVADRNTSQPLMDATSGLLLINSGIKRLMYSDLSPVTYSLATPGFGMDSRLNQPLPVGEYIVCYRLIDIDNKNSPLASECVRVIAEPLSPPQLIQPENEAVITEPRPVLTWTPPAPVYMFSSLGYDVVVSPLYSNQSPQEAMQRNTPVMTTFATSNSMLYPSSFSDLQAGKTYVWQVAAKDGNRYGGKSEIFQFTVMPDSVSKIISTAPYIKLDRDKPQVTVMHQGVLKLEYFNMLSDSIVKIEAYILTDKETKGRQQITFNLKVNPGQNFLEYKVNNRIRLDESAIYEARLVNSRGEAWLMRFNPKYYF